MGEREREASKIKGEMICMCYSGNLFLDVTIACYKTLNHNKVLNVWVPVSYTGKVYDGCIKDLGFNPRLHQKLIGVLV